MVSDIVISIINYRTAQLTIDCARSVLAQIGEVDGIVVIVDNSSNDGSVPVLENWMAALPAGAPVRLVRSPVNTGFSGGHNLGMAEARAKYYLLLNSDAVLAPGFLKRILKGARAHPEAGFIAPRLEGEDGKTQTSFFRFPGVLSEFIRGANSGPITRALAAHDVSLGSDPNLEEVDWVSFACVLLNGAMVDEIGPMDEGFFLYFEDAEYCLRARRAGWRIQHCPDAVAVHFRGGSGPVKDLARKRSRLPAYYYSSRTRFMYQAHGWAGLWAANTLWVVGRGMAELRRILGRKHIHYREAEIRPLWTNVWNPLGPRRAPGE